MQSSTRTDSGPPALAEVPNFEHQEEAIDDYCFFREELQGNFRRILLEVCEGNRSRLELLGQLIYWHIDHSDGSTRLRYSRPRGSGKLHLVKSHKDWHFETGLSRKTQERARTYLEQKGLLIKEVHKSAFHEAAPTVHYRLDFEGLLEALAEATLGLIRDGAGKNWKPNVGAERFEKLMEALGRIASYLPPEADLGVLGEVASRYELNLPANLLECVTLTHSNATAGRNPYTTTTYTNSEYKGNGIVARPEGDDDRVEQDIRGRPESGAQGSRHDLLTDDREMGKVDEHHTSSAPVDETRPDDEHRDDTDRGHPSIHDESNGRPAQDEDAAHADHADNRRRNRREDAGETFPPQDRNARPSLISYRVQHSAPRRGVVKLEVVPSSMSRAMEPADHLRETVIDCQHDYYEYACESGGVSKMRRAVYAMCRSNANFQARDLKAAVMRRTFESLHQHHGADAGHIMHVAFTCAAGYLWAMPYNDSPLPAEHLLRMLRKLAPADATSIYKRRSLPAVLTAKLKRRVTDPYAHERVLAQVLRKRLTAKDRLAGCIASVCELKTTSALYAFAGLLTNTNGERTFYDHHVWDDRPYVEALVTAAAYPPHLRLGTFLLTLSDDIRVPGVVGKLRSLARRRQDDDLYQFRDVAERVLKARRQRHQVA